MSIAAVGMAGNLGCGNAANHETATTEAKVSGIVTIRQTPTKGVEVIFIPTNAIPGKAGARTAIVNSDGTFEITTIVGHNDVRLGGPITKKEPTLAYATKAVEVLATGTVANLDFP